MKVRFTERVIEELRKRGANNKLFEDLAETITKIPCREFAIDSSDDMITVLGLPISFVRDHNNGETIIMTNEEAQDADRLEKKKDGYFIDVKREKWKTRFSTDRNQKSRLE